jgi:hypothetical protein
LENKLVNEHEVDPVPNFIIQEKVKWDIVRPLQVSHPLTKKWPRHIGQLASKPLAYDGVELL